MADLIIFLASLAVSKINKSFFEICVTIFQTERQGGSVTKFGEISTLWQILTFFRNFLVCFWLGYRQNFVPVLAILCHWANFQLYKRCPKVEK